MEFVRQARRLPVLACAGCVGVTLTVLRHQCWAATEQPASQSLRLLPSSGTTVKASDVLIIGGAGVTALPTIRALQATGRRIFVLSQPAKVRHRREPRREDGKGYLSSPQDKAMFLASLTDPTCPRVIIDFTSNSPHHIQVLLMAHRKRPMQHYVFMSTGMVYPGGPERMDISDATQPIREDAANLDSELPAENTFGERMRQCEVLLRRAWKEEGFPSTALRTASVIGLVRDGANKEVFETIVDGLAPLSPPTSSSARSPGGFHVTFSEDVAAVVSSVLNCGKAVHGEAFNVASAEYAQDHVAASGEGDEQEPVLQKLRRHGRLDTSKAQQMLDFQPIPLPEWIDAMTMETTSDASDSDTTSSTPAGYKPTRRFYGW